MKPWSSAVVGLGLALAFCGRPSDEGSRAPLARFTRTCSSLICAYLDGSTDDGTIVSRSWDFGDGSSSDEVNPQHTYLQSGSYVVTLAVTDNDGASSASSKDVTLATGDAILVGAGDIADCRPESRDEATAELITALPSALVFTLGDNAYPDGTAAEYGCYQSSWGAFSDRTRPVPGNHDYRQAGAGPYYAYFGPAAGPLGKGYYSYDLGNWHIVALNSEVSVSEQIGWLRADLAANPASCILAYWHKPFFTSSSVHPPDASMGPFWDELQAAGAEIVLSGHNHHYERFAPQLPDGTGSTGGIRQFVVGTGGYPGLYDFNPTPSPNSEIRHMGFGVLKLTLGSSGYSWEFLSIAGSDFTDTGSGACH